MKTVLIVSAILIAVTTSVAANQADSLANVVDSLFLRASSGEVKFQDMVEPSKEALIAMGEAAIPQMLTKLDTRDARETHTVVDIFKGIGEAAVKPLIGELTDKDDYVRRLAIRCLADIKSVQAVPDLIQYTEHEDYRTRAGAVRALGMIGDRAGAEAVMMALDDDNEVVATAATVACGDIKDGIEPTVLVKALYYPYYGVRYSAVTALTKIGKSTVPPIVAEFKNKPPVITRCYLLMALGEIGDPAGLTTIIDHFHTNDWLIKTYCAEALGKFDSAEAKKALTEAVGTETHPLVIAEIRKALQPKVSP